MGLAERDLILELTLVLTVTFIEDMNMLAVLSDGIFCKHTNYFFLSTKEVLGIKLLVDLFGLFLTIICVVIKLHFPNTRFKFITRFFDQFKFRLFIDITTNVKV